MIGLRSPATGRKRAKRAVRRSGFVRVAGEKDLAEGRVTVRDMTTGEQSGLPLDAVVDSIAMRLRPS